MLTPKTLNVKTRALIALAFAFWLTVLACSVNVKKDKSGEDKNVDIQTPLGGIHVDKGAEARDTGIPVYPGARIKQKDSSGDDKSANVNLSGFGYGLRVIAVEYESDDSPTKLVAYYKDQLKKFGDVLECHTHGSHVTMTHKSDSHALSCDSDGGNTVELKVGTDENQHIVSITPEDKGASFALVYVRMHGKDTI
jgi:hypothetical protein